MRGKLVIMQLTVGSSMFPDLLLNAHFSKQSSNRFQVSSPKLYKTSYSSSLSTRLLSS